MPFGQCNFPMALLVLTGRNGYLIFECSLSYLKGISFFICILNRSSPKPIYDFSKCKYINRFTICKPQCEINIRVLY